MNMNLYTTTWIRPKRATTIGAGILAATVVLLGIAGCGANDEDADSATQASAVTIHDPWVKAANSGMTAAFATLRNSADTKATVVSATCTASPRVELHETATGTDGQMTMRPKEGGFTLPAKGSHTLEPGADHIMMMKIAKPIKPGDTVPVTLTFADRSTKTFTVSARTFTGAKEDYTGDSDTGTAQDMGDSGHGNG